jgi:hypothetical protein
MHMDAEIFRQVASRSRDGYTVSATACSHRGGLAGRTDSRLEADMQSSTVIEEASGGPCLVDAEFGRTLYGMAGPPYGVSG